MVGGHGTEAVRYDALSVPPSMTCARTHPVSPLCEWCKVSQHAAATENRGALDVVAKALADISNNWHRIP